MEILKDNDTIDKESIVFIGNFDGVHIGHKRLLNKALKIKKDNENLVVVALSFYPHPKSIFTKDIFRTIFTLEEKAFVLKNFKCDYLKICEFDEQKKNLTPYDFITKYIHNDLNAKYVIVGEGYTFGKNKSGSVEVLKDICKNYGIQVIAESHLSDEIDKISSTHIRKYIKDGNVKKAKEQLGHPYFTSGIVVKGKQLGRTIGFPTANLLVEDEKLLPCNGVYSTKTIIGDKTYKSITNVGVNPTFNTNKKVVETHIFNYNGDLYDKEILVEFHDFVRFEKKFENIDELKKQIQIDVNKTV